MILKIETTIQPKESNGYQTSSVPGKPRHLLKALLLVLSVALLGACSSGPPRKPENICSIFEEKFGWHRAALKLQKKWKIPMNIPMAIMAQESTFRSSARPPRKKIFGFFPGPRASSAFGYSQALDGTWKGYLENTGEFWRKRDDYVDALDFINWYITKTVKVNKVKPTDTYALYLNYHEGFTGYRKQTYKKKKWLRSVARKVQHRANVYADQYAQCQSNLPRGWLR